MLPLVATACATARLEPAEGPALGADSDSSAWVDSASADSDPPDSGEPYPDTGEPPWPELPCHPRPLDLDDAVPLSTVAPIDEETPGDLANRFALYVFPTASPGAPGAWLYRSSTTESGHADSGYLLATVDDWRGAVIPEDRPFELSSGEGEGGGMTASGGTTDEAFPGEATWSVHWDEWSAIDAAWLFASHPEPGSTFDSTTARIEAGPSKVLPPPSSYDDYDGDGLDDILLPFVPAIAFLAPFTGTYAVEDADILFPADLDGASYYQHWYKTAARDLDLDGYPDLAWATYLYDEESGEQRVEIHLHAGPIAGAATWSAPDATIYDPAWTGSLTSTFVGVPDITGDGRPDLVVEIDTGSGVDATADTLFVIDRWVQGTESLDAFPNRLVGPPAEDPLDRMVLRGPSVGDVNGDGFDDLFTYAAGQDAAGRTSQQAWVALGPVEGIVSLPEQAVQIDVACRTEDCAVSENIRGSIIPDMNGDGKDDIVIGQSSGNYPGVAWLFPGCEEW
jgi:hypothetical protein